MNERGQPVAPDVSVVVPVHDAEATLPACLQSLQSQSLAADRYEIVVVDNNSRDGSAAVARLHPGVTVVEERRQGAYAARNRGLGLARGRVVAFTDPDCVAAPDWLEKALAALAVETVVAVGETIPAGSSRALELLSTYARLKDEFVFGGSDRELYYGRTNNMAVLRSVFDTVGPFVEQPRGADVLLVRAAIEHYGTGRVRFVSQMRVTHDELAEVGSYLRKMHIYGYAYHGYREAAPFRPLRMSERVRLLRAAAREAGSPAALPALVVLTAGAQLGWRLGGWRAAARLPAPRGSAPVAASAPDGLVGDRDPSAGAG
jgi:glycosyltransferase involved in cell wall biosynthesis